MHCIHSLGSELDMNITQDCTERHSTHTVSKQHILHTFVDNIISLNIFYIFSWTLKYPFRWLCRGFHCKLQKAKPKEYYAILWVNSGAHFSRGTCRNNKIQATYGLEAEISKSSALPGGWSKQNLGESYVKYLEGIITQVPNKKRHLFCKQRK